MTQKTTPEKHKTVKPKKPGTNHNKQIEKQVIELCKKLDRIRYDCAQL